MKKLKLITLIVIALGIIGFSAFSITYNSGQNESFEKAGYVLVGSYSDVKVIPFASNTKFAKSANQTVQFKSTDGEIYTIDLDSFIYFDDGEIMSLTSGVLLDFDDLSANFINHYTVSANLKMSKSNNKYSIVTSNGTIPFGENIWKLNANKYLVQSSKLKVHFSDEDVREVDDYIQINVTSDGIVEMLTKENLWMTISDKCYIETADGNIVYPTTTVVQNETYKMSIAKLTVDADENIVLSAAETREQTVPRFNIEVENGKNGADGTNGKSGTTGTTGSQGGFGKDGNDAYVSSSKTAIPTMSIIQWDVTSNSLQAVVSITDVGGTLAAVDSDKYKTYISITNEETSEVIYGYAATIVEGTGGYNISTIGLEYDDPATIAFNGNDDVVGFTTLKLDDDGLPIGSETLGYQIDALVPDTRYRLSIVGYYSLDNMVYRREFVSRAFYTDSMGVILSKASTTDDAITIKAQINDEFKDYVKNINVYLLTEQENKNYNNGGTIPSTAKVMQQAGISSYSPSSFTFEFTGINSNTQYVARVLVDIDNGQTTVSMITKQELLVSTLKEKPSICKQADGVTDQVPEVYFNRTTGAFEVLKPIVTDPDGGIVSYVFRAYKASNLDVAIASKTLDGNSNEVAMFYLDTYDSELGSTASYIFKVEALFNDNEKDVYLNLGRTTEISVQGDTLPTIKLDYNPESVTFNSFAGEILIGLQANSDLTIDFNHPLKINITADQIDVKNGTINFTSTGVGSAKQDTSGNNTYVISVERTSGYLKIILNLANLYQQTKYSINVSAYVDLNDGNGDNFCRSLGTVSFTTKKAGAVGLTWSAVASSTNALEVQCRVGSTVTGDELTHLMNELKKGQITVDLYQGTGNDKKLIATKNYNDADTLALFYTDDVTSGYHIVNSDFGNINIVKGVEYSISVRTITDGTYALTLGYVNQIADINFRQRTITATPQAPKLTAHPESAITVKNITNINARTYGAQYDQNLPDDAVIGFVLSSNYANDDRLAFSITYYAYEYSEFYNTMVGNKADPIRGDVANNKQPAQAVMTMTRSNGNNDVFSTQKLPSVAIIFGGDAQSTDAQATENYYDGCFVYYTGPASIVNGNLESGMCRGFRYIFAYTVQYTRTGSVVDTETYPYDHPDYNSGTKSYAKSYGAGYENGHLIGVDTVDHQVIAYVLNSGMKNAPAISPDFHTYLYSNEFIYTNMDELKANGMLNIRFRFMDYDGAINLTGTNANSIIYETGTIGNTVQTESVLINDCKMADSDWYQISVPYTVYKAASEPKIITPTIDITTYKRNYDNILTELEYINPILGNTGETFYLTTIPVDWDWGTTIDFYTTNYSINVTQTAYPLQNYIEFVFNGDNDVLYDIMSRAYRAKFTFSNASGSLVKEIYIPINVRNSDADGRNGTYYSNVTTGEIDTDFLGVEYTCSVEIIYDNGDIGFDCLEDSNEIRFGLQKLTKNSAGFYILGEYIKYDGSSASPLETMVYRVATENQIDTLQSSVGDTYFQNQARKRFAYHYDSAINTNVRFAYIDRYGVTLSSTSNMDIENGQYVILKGVGTITVQLTNPNYTIESMTPTVEGLTTRKNTNNFEIVAVSVSGLNQTSIPLNDDNTKTVHIALFDNIIDANNHTISNAVKTMDILVNYETGREISQEGHTFTNLEAGKEYYYLVYVDMSSSQNPAVTQKRICMKSGTSDFALYSFKTLEGIVITQKSNAEYQNKTYRSKIIEYSFGINNVYGVTLKYDLYSDEECTNLLIANDTLFAAGLISAPIPVASDYNTVQLNLSPNTARSLIIPGGTYYLKMTAIVDGDEKASQVIEFSLDAVENVGALVYVTNATRDTITFKVTANDKQKSLVTDTYLDTDETLKEKALYTVRFTDYEGNRIPTIYDDQIYDGSILKQTFVLSNENLTAVATSLGISITLNTTYIMKVYAMIDNTHCGNLPVDVDLTEKSYIELIDNNYEMFMNTIDSFWTLQESTEPGEYNKLIPNELLINTIESHYLLASKTQRTTQNSSYYLDTTEALMKRKTATLIQLVLSESFGIVDDNGNQVFGKIVWSVTGYTNDGEPFASSGTVITALEQGFQLTTDQAGYPKFTYDIPTDVPYGEYRVVIALYRFNDSSSLVATLNLKIG